MGKTIVQIGNLSDVGKKRAVNEDYYGSFNGEFGNLIIVCDGMGGHKGGATASRLAVDTIKLHFVELTKNFEPISELKLAINKANSEIIQKASESEELKEMGSTAVVLLIKDNNAYYAHIGDSRIYLIRENKIHQLTKDHSLVQQLIDSGIVNKEEANDHPKKNVITRSLGAEGKDQPEIAEPISIFKDDIFILCTDGLSGYLNDNELYEIASNNDPQTACQKMVSVANERGGKDNITVQIVKVIKGKRLPLRISPKIKKLIISSAIGLSIILMISFYLILGLPNPVKFFIPLSPTDSTVINETKKVLSQPDSTIKMVETEIKNDRINDSISFSLETNNDTIKTKVERETKNENGKTIKKRELK